MAETDITPLLDDLERVDSLEELQAHVLLANDHIERRASIELPAAADEPRPAVVDDLEGWLERLRERLADLASTRGATSYAISVSGTLTGPSVSVTITYSSR